MRGTEGLDGRDTPSGWLKIILTRQIFAVHRLPLGEAGTGSNARYARIIHDGAEDEVVVGGGCGGGARHVVGRGGGICDVGFGDVYRIC